MAPSNTPRHFYSPAQILAYYNRIQLPQAHRHKPGDASAQVARDPQQGLEFLAALQRYHLAHIPFENLGLHYSRDRVISIDPVHIFEKIVGRGMGRGGRCMESNGLLSVVLRSLGFDVYPIGARINTAIHGDNEEKRRYKGFSHMVLIISFGSARYIADVGVGSPSPTGPIALNESSERPEINFGTQARRLRRLEIPELMSKELMWVYEVQHDVDGPWIPIFAFTEQEFVPGDFEVMNYYTSHSPESPSVRKIQINKFILNNDELVGTVSCSGNRIKRRIKGIQHDEIELKSEQERIQAFEEYLGIKLLPEERAGIVGSSSEISP